MKKQKYYDIHYCSSMSTDMHVKHLYVVTDMRLTEKFTKTNFIKSLTTISWNMFYLSNSPKYKHAYLILSDTENTLMTVTEMTYDEFDKVLNYEDDNDIVELYKNLNSTITHDCYVAPAEKEVSITVNRTDAENICRQLEDSSNGHALIHALIDTECFSDKCIITIQFQDNDEHKLNILL